MGWGEHTHDRTGCTVLSVYHDNSLYRDVKSSVCQVCPAVPVCGLLCGGFGCCCSSGCWYAGQSFSGNRGSCWRRCGCSSRSDGDIYCTPYGPVTTQQRQQVLKSQIHTVLYQPIVWHNCTLVAKLNLFWKTFFFFFFIENSIIQN